MATTAPVWAIKQGQDIVPLIPEFDPEAEEIDPEVQTRVQEILESLASVQGARGRPVLLSRKTLFQVTETYLEKIESPVPPPASLELAWLVVHKVVPLVPLLETRTIAALAGSEQTLTEEQEKAVLGALSQSPHQ